MKATIEEKIDHKLTSFREDSNGLDKSVACASNNIGKSYANALKSVRREEKNEEKIEIQEVEKRANNIIIHGALEVGDDENQINEEDREYVKDVLTQLGVANEPKSFSRLGKPNEKKQRPLKLVMMSKDDKDKAMGNLRVLKGTGDKFGKISVTDDYTNAEREEIKSWVEKAKERSAEDTDKIYKVRGDPKNGLRLIWFKKN